MPSSSAPEPKRTIIVTEPDCFDGRWRLAMFMYDHRLIVTHEELENRPSRSSVAHYLRGWRELMVGTLAEWLRPLPPVFEWSRRPEISEEHATHADCWLLRLRASGHFDLGNEEQIEELMKWVTDDDATPVRIDPLIARWRDP